MKNKGSLWPLTLGDGRVVGGLAGGFAAQLLQIWKYVDFSCPGGDVLVAQREPKHLALFWAV